MKQQISFLIIIISLLLIQPGSAASGDILWQQTLGGSTGEEWGYSLDSTADGGVLVTGIAYSADGNVTGAHGNGDLWVVRLGADGTPLWNRAFGGNESDYGLSVKSTADGGSIIIGTTGSNNGDISGYHGNGDLWILRLSPTGALLWQKVYGGNMTDEGGDVLQTPDGGFVLAGYTMSDDGDASGHHGGGDLWMIRLDQSGSIVWQKAFGGSRRDSGSSVIRTSDGGYAMTGNTYSIDGNVTMNHGSSDLWVIKTDDKGTLLWQKAYGGSKLDWGHSLIELPGGDLLVAGVTVSADDDVSLNHGAGDVWVLRLTSDGQKIWEKTYGGSFSDNVWKVDLSPNGGAYLTGETFSVDGDVTKNQGDADLWAAEIGANGSLIWSRTLGGQNYESGAWVKLMPDGNLVITGTTRSEEGDVKNAKGGGDLWVAKIDAHINSSADLILNVSAIPHIPENMTGNMTNIPSPVSLPPNLSEVQNQTSIPPAVDIKANQTLMNGSSSVGMNKTVSTIQMPVIPGSVAIPTDSNGDGRYEDMNGNGKIDLQDPAIFFANYEWIKDHFSPGSVDFNLNGVVDFGDISALFAEASG